MTLHTKFLFGSSGMNPRIFHFYSIPGISDASPLAYILQNILPTRAVVSIHCCLFESSEKFKKMLMPKTLLSINEIRMFEFIKGMDIFQKLIQVIVICSPIREPLPQTSMINADHQATAPSTGKSLFGALNVFFLPQILHKGHYCPLYQVFIIFTIQGSLCFSNKLAPPVLCILNEELFIARKQVSTHLHLHNYVPSCSSCNKSCSPKQRKSSLARIVMFLYTPHHTALHYYVLSFNIQIQKILSNLRPSVP